MAQPVMAKTIEYWTAAINPSACGYVACFVVITTCACRFIDPGCDPHQPTIFFMLVIASSCGLMRVHAALINPHFFKNGDVSIPSRYEKQTPRKIPNEINGLLADFDGKTVAVPDFLNGLYLS
jgi:hypothetical protein